jgi:hypothetical protein
MAPTVPGTTPPGLSDSAIARITSAVTQAVMESLQMPQHNPVTLPLESNTREVPLQGISVADAQGQGPVAAAMENLTGASINDGISSEHTAVCYSRVDDAISMIKKLCKGCFLAKTDIKNAFRIIPICPQDYDLLGIFWQGKFYYDRAMPMGCASSCRTFETFSTALQWVAQKHLNIAHLVHILDDYLMAASSYDQCCTDLKNFLSLCEYLGVPIAQEKTVGPRTTLTFAGIELDTICLKHVYQRIK